MYFVKVRDRTYSLNPLGPADVAERGLCPSSTWPFWGDMDEAEDNSFRVTHQVQYLSISQALPGCLPELPSLGTSRKTTVIAPEYLPDLPKLPTPSSVPS